jgi:hypothetical protein
VSTRFRQWLCGLTVFALIFVAVSFSEIWLLGPDDLLAGYKGDAVDLWMWLANLPKVPPGHDGAYRPHNIRSCAIFLGISIGLGAVGFWLGRSRRRDEVVGDYKDGRLGSEKDRRFGQEKAE